MKKLFIGGEKDGDMEENWLCDRYKMATEDGYDIYRIERFIACGEIIEFYVLEGISAKEVLERLIEGYHEKHLDEVALSKVKAKRDAQLWQVSVEREALRKMFDSFGKRSVD